MYSVVLLMALSGGAEAPDLGHHKSCSGCSGGYVASCSGGCSGGYVVASCSGGSSCHGGGHKLFGGHKHSCCGGSSCCGGGYISCSGCTGGYMGCSGGYMGCSGGYIMDGGSMYMPPPPPTGGEKLGPPKEKGKGKDEVSAPATIVLSLPADAKVSIDGFATTSTAATRTFVTPELVPAKEFVYTLSAQVVRDGQTLTVSEQVTVRAGDETRVSFGLEKFTAPTVAAK